MRTPNTASAHTHNRASEWNAAIETHTQMLAWRECSSNNTITTQTHALYTIHDPIVFVHRFGLCGQNMFSVNEETAKAAIATGSVASATPTARQTAGDERRSNREQHHLQQIIKMSPTTKPSEMCVSNCDLAQTV